jgi:hypothetical protein
MPLKGKTECYRERGAGGKEKIKRKRMRKIR